MLNLWRFLIADIVVMLLIWFQALQPEGNIPHAEYLVIILWALVGGLALLIVVLLRLWYRDFTEWKKTIGNELKELRETQTVIREELGKIDGTMGALTQEHRKQKSKRR